jgi:hypothetical protein
MSTRTVVPGLALLSVLMAGALVGCGGGGDASGGSSAGSAAAARPAPADQPADGMRDAVTSAEDYDGSAGAKNRVEPGPDAMAPAIIRKGNVELRADDVGKAQFDVRRTVDRYAGDVTEEKTTTGDDGRPAYTNMVLRIPTGSFDEAMADLRGSQDAELVSANSSEDDVTTKLIDTRTRVAAQRRSIARITVLFDRAQSIRDVMAIEAELSRRQADLDSLERQLAYLRGQTSMSTITVSIDRTAAPAVKKADDHESGFVAGLSAGWDALAAFAVGLATVLGALLPWLVVLGIVGPPLWLLGRRVRRRVSARNPGRTPSAA